MKKIEDLIKAKDSQKYISTLSFEDGMELIESLVEKIEQGDLVLEQAIQAYERGDLLLKHLREILNQAEAKVELIKDRKK